MFKTKNELFFYLYFLNKNNFNKLDFLNEFFHFVRFLNLKTNNKFDKIFYFLKFEVVDPEYDGIIKTLKFHNLISDDLLLTDSGKLFINDMTLFENNKDFIKLFEDNYSFEAATANSCFYEEDYFNINCSKCKNKTCLKETVSLKDLIPKNFKLFKNPYKKWSI